MVSPATMRRSWPFWVVLALAVAALAASTILLVDYARTSAPVFCGVDGGCGQLRKTAFARPLGIPTPVFGVGGFFAIALCQLVAGRRARLAQAMLAVFGGIVAGGLILVQASLRTVCPCCMVADVSALGLMVLSVSRAVRGWDPPEGRRAFLGSAAALLAAIAVPAGIGLTRKAIPVDVPAVVAAEMRATGRGRVTVVDFVDFECPFCRMTHAELAPLVAARSGKVRVARKHVPLRMHPHAFDAARAACCGEAQGKGEEVAEALFVTPPGDLTPDGCEAIARDRGLDVARFRECFRDPATDARIQKDVEAFRSAKGHGLPTIYIDGTLLEGAQERDTLEATLDAAIRAL